MARLGYILLLFTSALCFSQQKPDSAAYKALLKEYDEVKNANPALAFRIATQIEKISLDRNDLFFYSDALFKKAVLYYFQSKYDSAEYFASQSLNAAQGANNYKALMKADNLLGAISYNKGELNKAVEFYTKKAKTAADNKDTSAEMETYYNIGLVLFQKGEYYKSAEANFRALDYFERKRDTFNIFSCLHSIGYTYMHLEDLQGALHYFNRAAGTARHWRDKYSLTGIYIDLSTLYDLMKRKDSSFYYIDQALKLAAQEKDEFHFVIATNQKAKFYLQDKHYSQALNLAREAIGLDLRANRKLSLCETYETAAQIFHNSGSSDSALVYAYKAYVIASEQNKPSVLQTCSKILSSVYEKRKSVDSALKYFKLYTQFNDTLKKESQLRGIAQKEFVYEKQNQEDMRHREQLIAEARIEQQRKINVIVVVASVLLLIFLVAGIFNYRQKQKANAQVLIQKKLLEDKNKEVSDSINYASRIQKSIMPDDTSLQHSLPDGFVLFLPKDIVSGDFYWVNNIKMEDGFHEIIAVADCTGHGVPGAFMSLIGVTILNQTLNNSEINNPAQALDFLNVQLPKNIKSSSSTGTIKDGMEICIAEINRQKLELQFAGANNNLYLVRAGELMLIKGDKRSIGLGHEGATNFSNNRMALKKGDMIYMCSDGYPDQFGGPAGKKFKYKQMEELFKEVYKLPLSDQRKTFFERFKAWKGSLEQVDDVCIIGIRI